jgi:hypothetical protein
MQEGDSYIVKSREHYGQLQKITIIEVTELTYLIDFELINSMKRMFKKEFEKHYRIVERLL